MAAFAKSPYGTYPPPENTSDLADFKADTGTLHVSREKDGKSGLVYVQIERFQGRPRREVPALRCPAVTCNVS